MRYRVTRLSVHQTAKTMAFLYAAFGLVFLPFGVFLTLLLPQREGPGLVFWLIFPILYGVIGYVAVAIGCALYNLIAGLAGGVEAELEQVGRLGV